MGSCPWWYPFVRVSRYLQGVPPWEIARQPKFWLEAALAAEKAEYEAFKPKES